MYGARCGLLLMLVKAIVVVAIVVLWLDGWVGVGFLI